MQQRALCILCAVQRQNKELQWEMSLLGVRACLDWSTFMCCSCRFVRYTMVPNTGCASDWFWIETDPHVDNISISLAASGDSWSYVKALLLWLHHIWHDLQTPKERGAPMLLLTLSLSKYSSSLIEIPSIYNSIWQASRAVHQRGLMKQEWCWDWGCLARAERHVQAMEMCCSPVGKRELFVGEPV